MSSGLVPVPRERNPYARDGVVADASGVPGYADLPASLAAMLRAHAEASPEVEAVVEIGGRRLTYGELWAAARRVAGGLVALGVEPGDRVALRHPAGADWVVGFWGTVMAGAIAVAVNTRATPADMEFVLRDAAVAVDLTPDTGLPDGEPVEPAAADPDDVAALFYTSGTTGRPKGVPTTHRAFLTCTENMLRGAAIDASVGAGLRTLISVPLFHVTGCNAQLLTATRAGGTSVILPAFDQAAAVSAIADERISFMITVPAIYALLLRRQDFAALDVGHVRWVGYGGAPIAPTLVHALMEAFPAARVFNGYGMTETCSVATILPHDEAAEHADSVGYALPSVDLAVAPLGDDPQLGELCVRGAGVTGGYWRRPEADAETIVDGWLHTGDIVRVDDAGRIHIVDRIKDIIMRGGENIASVEVEAVLAAAPGVLEAAVLAVPDDVMGEKVGAVLHGPGPIDVDAVLAHCRTHLADYKVPQYVSIAAGPLPRNAGGKILKATLRGEVSWGDALR